MLESIQNAYIALLALAMPAVLFISACNLCFRVIVSAFSSGVLRFGGGK